MVNISFTCQQFRKSAVRQQSLRTGRLAGEVVALRGRYSKKSRIGKQHNATQKSTGELSSLLETLG